LGLNQKVRQPVATGVCRTNEILTHIFAKIFLLFVND